MRYLRGLSARPIHDLFAQRLRLGSNYATRNKKAPPELLKNSRGATQRSHTMSPVHHDYLTIAIDPRAVNYRVL